MDISGGEYIEVNAADLTSGYIYAPYIPLQVSPTPTLNISDLKPKPKIYKIRKYNKIYSDIKERFDILDL